MPIALYTTGLLLTFLAGAMALPMAIDLVRFNQDWGAFGLGAALTLFAGVSLMMANARDRQESLSVHHSYLVTSLAWVILPLFGALPFMFSDMELSFTDAVFESVSGLTTTGSTVLVGLDTLAPGLLLWRSLLQWIGGIGIIVMGIAILPLLNVGGMQLMRTESSDTSEKVLPRAKKIAAGIGVAYIGLTVLCTITYGLLGMSSFDALNHALTTISTGGYSTHDSSFGYFDNPALLWAGTLFMISGALPFTLYIRALSGRPHAIWLNSQVQTFLGGLAVVTLAVTAWLTISGTKPFFAALTEAAFNVASVITTTGFASTDYGQWAGVSVLFLVITFAGGCSGSTSGAVKVFRYQLMWIFLKSHVNRLIYPHGTFLMTYQGREISNDVIFSVTSFLGVYLFSWLALAAALSASNLDLITSLSAAATAITNVGPGLGPLVGPAGNFAALANTEKWLLCAGMILGRLELFTLLVVITPRFWRDL